jgi:hypothetical protein
MVGTAVIAAAAGVVGAVGAVEAEATISIVSATVWALGYMTQVPSHLLSFIG